MKNLRYEEPQPISRTEIEAALRSQEDQVTASALITDQYDGNIKSLENEHTYHTEVEYTPERS
ncbi:MAG TPA: hypothetical protein VKY85_20305 [Candidatus Angelobacter sp.]|nr:hypothetical protein [Candidatus Angelobacter sp.]